MAFSVELAEPRAIGVCYDLVLCPKCKTLVEPQPEYPVPGSCQNCGNVYFWDKGAPCAPYWEEGRKNDTKFQEKRFRNTSTNVVCYLSKM